MVHRREEEGGSEERQGLDRNIWGGLKGGVLEGVGINQKF